MRDVGVLVRRFSWFLLVVYREKVGKWPKWNSGVADGAQTKHPHLAKGTVAGGLWLSFSHSSVSSVSSVFPSQRVPTRCDIVRGARTYVKRVLRFEAWAGISPAAQGFTERSPIAVISCAAACSAQGFTEIDVIGRKSLHWCRAGARIYGRSL
ncbi:hypothetical protein [Bifidobacterium leontopitheci]|uniref:hypothetical protein n=1 Tax=Bifidobacterium leontopitheci TaxID=2650774 RepID=UPI0036705FB5